MTPEGEREANLFAMELLMPYDMLKRDVAEIGGIDPEGSDEKSRHQLKYLAKRYKVSEQVMMFRLGQILA